MDALIPIALVVGSYVVGSLPIGLLVAKAAKGVDIREHGSGNIGATNVARVLGVPWGITVFALDLLKGLLPTLAAAHLVPESAYAPPLVVVAFQWFGHAAHMCALPVTPVLGATVIDAAAWEQVPSELRPALVTAALEIGESLSQETVALDARAIIEMEKRGLIIDEVGPESLKEWRLLAEAGIHRAVQGLVPPEAVERVTDILSQYRGSEY